MMLFILLHIIMYWLFSLSGHMMYTSLKALNISVNIQLFINMFNIWLEYITLYIIYSTLKTSVLTQTHVWNNYPNPQFGAKQVYIFHPTCHFIVRCINYEMKQLWSNFEVTFYKYTLLINTTTCSISLFRDN